MKSITCIANIDIVTSSKIDRKEPAVVMQIKFTELINTRTEKSIGDIIYSFMT